MSSNSTNAEVFVYTGAGGVEVPDDVVRVLIDPSVTSIPNNAFEDRMRLAEVELCEGLVEIGERSFGWCDHKITKINIPNSLRRINDWAFWKSLLRCPIRLHDGIERIGRGAFSGCIFTNFRVPLLITVIPQSMLSNCKSTFSLELPNNSSEIKNYAFYNCSCLRNVAFPPDAVFGDEIFFYEEGEDDYDMNIFTDLQLLFGNSNGIITRALQHRFDGLPIHSIVYYQSYNQGVLQHLMDATNMTLGQRRSLRKKLDPTGNQQDCLGMTPLHILACSSAHDLELYRVIVTNYPANLITEDRWGALPLLYAFWGAAPREIIQFLVDSYKSLYPNHVFNWTMMVETMGRCDTPKESVEKLLRVKQMHFPKQTIDWEYLIDKCASSSSPFSWPGPFKERLQFLVMCGMSDSVEALAFKVWRDYIKNMVHSAEFKFNKQFGNENIVSTIKAKITHFKAEYPKLKEITTTLELALWKLSMNKKSSPEEATPCQKKIKTDESSMRRQYRITCGADVVIRHVLPYLIITVADEESDSYAESDSNASSVDKSDEESDSNVSSDDESSDSM